MNETYLSFPLNRPKWRLQIGIQKIVLSLDFWVPFQHIGTRSSLSTFHVLLFYYYLIPIITFSIFSDSFIMLISDNEALTIVRYLANQRSLFDTFEIYLSPVRIFSFYFIWIFHFGFSNFSWILLKSKKNWIPICIVACGSIERPLRANQTACDQMPGADSRSRPVNSASASGSGRCAQSTARQLHSRSRGDCRSGW